MVFGGGRVSEGEEPNNVQKLLPQSEPIAHVHTFIPSTVSINVFVSILEPVKYLTTSYIFKFFTSVIFSFEPYTGNALAIFQNKLCAIAVGIMTNCK